MTRQAASRTPNCARLRCLIFWIPDMINRSSEVPPPSATGWLVDLAKIDGPRFVVLCTVDDDALGILAHHLVQLRGALAPSAADLRADAEVEPIGVVW